MINCVFNSVKCNNSIYIIELSTDTTLENSQPPKGQAIIYECLHYYSVITFIHSSST